MKQLVLLSFFITASLISFSQTVQTQYGPVIGHLNENVYEFLGIPYASPPIGSLRWKPTQEHENWTNPILADSFPPACPQKRFEQGEPDSVFYLEGQEDCLYLNIWTPDMNSNLPVMLFIHGGGNQQGSTGQIKGGTEIYHGKNLSERGDVVVVSIQYRLGALGYLVHPGLEVENEENISGNYAVMDQIFALQWVQNNIANFGGDPNNVTIFGESAGGLNVGNLLTTSQASGLFHKAIIQSAAPVINDYDDSKSKGIDFVNEYISSGTDEEKIEFMREIHPDSMTIKLGNSLSGGVVQMNWQPVVDDIFFTDYPDEIFKSGNFNQVPLMIGSNSEEMSFAAQFYPNIIFPILVDSVIEYTVPEEYWNQAYELYPDHPAETAKESFIGILTDAQFTSTTRRTAECISLNQQEPVWRYFFTHKHTFSGGDELGSYHGMELFYVFNNWENATLGLGPLFKPADDSVQQIMLTYWTHFAYNGNPNLSGFPEWHEFDASSDPYMNIKAIPNGNNFGLRTEKCNLWDIVSGYDGCSGVIISENEIISNCIVYPNPSNGNFYINNKNKNELYIEVYNSIGQKLLEFRNPEFINMTSVVPGIYFFKIQSSQGTNLIKVIKE